MPSELRVAIVGVGFGAAVLGPAFARDPRVRIAGFTANDPERARAAAAKVSGAQAWASWQEAVASPAVDALAIAVPPALQPEIIRAAAAAKKHVFCEKPVALDARTARDLASAIREAGVANAVDFEFGELASWKRAAEVVREAPPSTWKHFAITWRVETRANRLGAHPWKNARALGGGALLGFGSHVFYGVEHLLGRATRVAARLFPSASTEADKRVDAWVELEGGIAGTVSIATDAVHGSGFSLELYGEDRALRLENRSSDHLRNYVLTMRRRDDSAFETLVDERPRDATPAPTGDGRIEPVSSLARRFVDAALGGEPVRPGLDEGARVDSILEAIRVADVEGTWQEIR